jgi:heme/copper-type cytochrome/quinol oxidase subunit 4
MNPSFTETQKFNKWWHYLIAGFLVISTTVIFFLVQSGIVQTKNNQKEPLFFILTISFLILAFIWFLYLKLETTITEKGILTTFRGIPFAKKNIEWNEIQSISVIKYSPLTDYGGWGVRYSVSGNGWCYNVSGNYGIKLIRANGKPFLIGTQQQDEAEKIINHYFKK